MARKGKSEETPAPEEAPLDLTEKPAPRASNTTTMIRSNGEKVVVSCNAAGEVKTQILVLNGKEYEIVPLGDGKWISKSEYELMKGLSGVESSTKKDGTTTTEKAGSVPKENGVSSSETSQSAAIEADPKEMHSAMEVVQESSTQPEGENTTTDGEQPSTLSVQTSVKTDSNDNNVPLNTETSLSKAGDSQGTADHTTTSPKEDDSSTDITTCSQTEPSGSKKRKREVEDDLPTSKAAKLNQDSSPRHDIQENGGKVAQETDENSTEKCQTVSSN